MEQVLIDGNFYNVIKKIDLKSKSYLYLQNDKTEDLLIQKLIGDDLMNLDDQEEVEKALLLYTNQYIKDAQS